MENRAVFLMPGHSLILVCRASKVSLHSNWICAERVYNMHVMIVSSNKTYKLRGL